MPFIVISILQNNISQTYNTYEQRRTNDVGPDRFARPFALTFARTVSELHVMSNVTTRLK